MVNAREEVVVVGFDQAFIRATGRARRKTLESMFFLSSVRGRSDEREVGQDYTYAMLQASVKHGKQLSHRDHHVRSLLAALWPSRF